jgi:hypothetical protein
MAQTWCPSETRAILAARSMLSSVAASEPPRLVAGDRLGSR